MKLFVGLQMNWDPIKENLIDENMLMFDSTGEQHGLSNQSIKCAIVRMGFKVFHESLLSIVDCIHTCEFAMTLP